jgi:hypothetical protein
MTTKKCTWDGCAATSEAPADDHWRYRFPWLEGWPHDLASGWYCPAHADPEAADRRMRLGRRRRRILT